MTTTERQQSLAAARRAAWNMCDYARREMFPDDQMRIDIECLYAEFTRLDEKERNQAKAGARGAVHGVKGGRPKKTGGKK